MSHPFPVRARTPAARMLAAAVLVLVGAGACSIDPLFLDLGDDTVEYRFDNAILGIDRRFAVDESRIHTFPLESRAGAASETIWALYVGDPGSIAADTVMVYCHGNAPSLNDYWNSIALLANTGGKHRFGVLAIDYRGFGRSTGTPTADGFEADVVAAIDWLVSRGLTGDRLVLFGNSLGAVPATLGATQTRTIRPAKLILEAPFPGISAALQGATGLSLPGSFLSALGEADAVEEIARYGGALLWIHARDDPVVPFAHGERLFDAHSGAFKVALNPETGGHDPLKGLGEDAYLAAIEAFLARSR